MYCTKAGCITVLAKSNFSFNLIYNKKIKIIFLYIFKNWYIYRANRAILLLIYNIEVRYYMIIINSIYFNRIEKYRKLLSYSMIAEYNYLRKCH